MPIAQSSVVVSMDSIPTLTTERLILRPWREEDRVEFASMSADPRVMEFMPGLLTRTQSDAVMERVREHWRKHDCGWWALEIRGGARFIGFAGLWKPTFSAHFTPCVEIGWRLAAEHWGKGYATEAARASLAYGFNHLAMNEIVSFTTVSNQRSRRVMKRLGMSHDASDSFEHPALTAGHPLRTHVLYRLLRGGGGLGCKTTG
jgi:RimJ/RimL family protein N-acetyltransferase